MAREIPYGFDTQVFGRSGGNSAVAKAAYRAGARLVDRQTGEMFDFTRKDHVAHTEILAPTGAPEWVFDREELWNRVHSAERKSNSQLCREVRLTLPRDLTREQQIELVREHIKNEYTSRGMVADFAIHNPPASDGGEQPHAHILLTMRELDSSGPHGFAKRKELGLAWNEVFTDPNGRAFRKARRGDNAGKMFVAATEGLERLRADWAALENQHLARTGIDGRVDHRTLAEQRADALARGDLEAAERLNRPPEPKLRPGEGKRKQTTRSAEIEEIRAFKAEVAEVVDLAAERRRRHRSPEEDKATLWRVRHDHSPAAIARRKERARRIAEARARMSTLDSGNQAIKDRYKLKLLQQRYQQEIAPEVARSLAWVRVRGASGEVVVQTRDGGRVRDDGAALRARGDAGDSAMAVMIAAARSHGWTEINLTGSLDFQQRSAVALTRAGIRVANADLAEVVHRTRAAMAAEAVAAEAAFVQRHQEQAEQRQKQYQRAAQEQEWIGPDGRRRPFMVRVQGLPQPVPARLSENDVRQHLQPESAGARELVNDLRSTLTERRNEYSALGTLGRLKASGKKAEIDSLAADLLAAERRVANLEEAWRAGLSAQAQDMLRRADKMRDAAQAVRDTATANTATEARNVSDMRTLSLTLKAMAERGELTPSPAGLDDAQRLDWLRQQADEWRKSNGNDGGGTGNRMGMRRP